jgi:hypothetical protein
MFWLDKRTHPCEQYKYFASSDNGATLIISSFDRETGKVTAFAIEGSGRMASDTWVVECPH